MRNLAIGIISLTLLTPTNLYAKPIPRAAIMQLLAAPTDTNCERFEARYGKGSAAKYIGRK